MTNLDGWAHDRWNSGGMLFAEAGIGVLAAACFVALAKLLLRRRTTSRQNNLPSEPTDQESSTP
jgi:hypothetical protein